MNMIKELFLINNRTGCRFITVDAYNNPDTLKFYKKNGFDFVLDGDLDKKQRGRGEEDDETKIMYFDLSTYQTTGK
jgi:hypothetical protein